MKMKMNQLGTKMQAAVTTVGRGLRTSGRVFIGMEWRRWRRFFVSELLWLFLPLFLLLVGYLMDKTVYFQMANNIKSLPETMYAFLGWPPQVASSNFLFFILCGMMPLNIYLAKRKCRQVVQAVWWDERSGIIHSLLNQLVGRKQWAAYKYLWLMGSFCLEYLLWHLGALLLAMIGSINTEQRMVGLDTMTQSFFMGGFVLVLLQSGAYLYALKKKPTDYAEMRVANWLVFGTLFLGNIYKIRDLVIWLSGYFNEKTSLTIPVEGVAAVTGWLNQLRWLSPLSWLNPYLEMKGEGLGLRMLIALGLTVVMVLLGQVVYKRRRIL